MYGIKSVSSFAGRLQAMLAKGGWVTECGVRFRLRVYDITFLFDFATGLHAIVTECSNAARSKDTRGKYFFVSARGYDPSVAKFVFAKSQR